VTLIIIVDLKRHDFNPEQLSVKIDLFR